MCVHLYGSSVQCKGLWKQSLPLSLFLCKGGSWGLCKGEIVGTWTLKHANTFTVNSTHCRLHRWTWPQSRHTHIHINICMGNHSSSQWRSITAHHSHKPTPGGACALYGTQSAAFYWLDTNMVNFRLQEWTLHSGSEHIVIHARGSENKPKWPF